ncbi:hypothetical protein EC973_009237 [Apophysomyces ossiformis]|uniref:RNA-binding protein n=1 Tax=Apophysomyces ossiformis TaxID=679940 RepID=A0A8H7BM30_9FUNG|nr:hypothetical protein EC973_009237 [Apophysomyces ossiformis]
MFPQKQQQAFKFLIRSKLSTEETIVLDEKKTVEKPIEKPVETPVTETPPATKSSSSDASAVASEADDRKRKRSEKDNTVPLASKKIHSQLQKWNQKKAELKQVQTEETESELPEDDFADLSMMACLLCQRKFKTKQDLERHQELSELHKKNLRDPVSVGKAQMKKRYVKSKTEQAEDQMVEQNYRNRAAERRQAFGQPDKPVLSEPKYRSSGAPVGQTRPRTDVDTTMGLRHVEKVASVKTPLADDNVGARMLKQMGWRRGEGLGKDGSGIVDPITAQQYAQGAGLGTAYAKRDISATAGSDSYKDRVKEMARRRFEEAP